MVQLAKLKKLLAVETSLQSGTFHYQGVLKSTFPNFKWKNTNDESGRALHYFETKEEAESIDFLIYVNLDTSNPSSLSLWTETDFDPLNITLKKGRLFGLGASHEKASVTPVLSAISNLKSDKKYIVFVGGYGRELNMIGAKRCVAEIIKKRAVQKVVVIHPTNNRPSFSSSGRTKIEVFFPFSDEEKKERDRHDLRENISSQSKIINKFQGESLKDDVIFKALEPCANLPSGTLLLDFSGGTNTITEAQSVYFEIDSSPLLEDSMVSRISEFSKTLEELNLELINKFSKRVPPKALHIGKAVTTTEGVSFYGYNLIPSLVSPSELNAWFRRFESTIKKNQGVIRIRDTKKSFAAKQIDSNIKGTTDCLKVTEATIFSRYFEDVRIFGVGEEGLSQKPNEYLIMDELVVTEDYFTHLFTNDCPDVELEQ